MSLSIKARAYLAVAAAVVVVVAAGVLSVSLQSAGASTAACGSTCASPSVQLLGTGQVLTVSGSSVKLAAASSTDTAQDWSPELEGTVTGAIAATLIPAQYGFQYSGDYVYEFQYAPGGKPSDQCLSAVYSDVDDGYVDAGLSQCGISSVSLWIMDGPGSGGYVDYINAGFDFSVSNGDGGTDYYVPFAEPGVLTASSSGSLSLTALSDLGGVVDPSQNWSISWMSAAAIVREKATIQARVKAGLQAPYTLYDPSARSNPQPSAAVKVSHASVR
jgi:hypothetical protein